MTVTQTTASLKKYDTSFENPSSKSPAIPPPALDENYSSTFARIFEPSSLQKKKDKQSARSNRLSNEEVILKRLFFSPAKNTSNAAPSNSSLFETYDDKRGVQSNRVLKVDTDIIHSNNAPKPESSNSHQTLPRSALVNPTWNNALVVQPASAQAQRSSHITYQNLFSRQADTSPENVLVASKARREVLIKTYTSNVKKEKQRPHSSAQKPLSQSKSSNQAEFESIIKDIKRVVPSPDVVQTSTYEDKKHQYKLKRNEEGSFELAAPKDTFNQILRGDSKVSSQQLREIQSSLKGIPIGANVTQKARKIKKASLEKETKPFISIVDHQQPQQTQDTSSALSDLVSNNSNTIFISKYLTDM